MNLVGLSVAVAITAALTSTGCGGEEPQAMQAAVVDTVRVAAEDVPRTVAAIGTVEADHNTTVAAEVDGAISAILREEGSSVGAGTAVLQIDPGPYRFVVQSAQADLGRARTQLDVDERLLKRYEALLAAGAVDRATYEDLEARVASGRAAMAQARATLQTAQWNLGKTTIRAPFAGAVGKRHVQLGQSVSSGDELFDLVDANPLRVRFRLPETTVGAVKTGDPVRFRLRSDTVAARVATVDYVSPEINPETRTFEVTARYTNPEGGAVPGAYADVEVTTETREDAPVVPEAALVTEGEQNYVYVVIAGPKAERREVEVGSRVDDRVEIVSGVRPGEVVIVAGQHGLPSGADIRYAHPDTTRTAGPADTAQPALRPDATRTAEGQE
jgi:membrane fusion protein (multidrug efflux system)